MEQLIVRNSTHRLAMMNPFAEGCENFECFVCKLLVTIILSYRMSEMSRYGYLKVFQWVSWTLRKREFNKSTVHLQISWILYNISVCIKRPYQMVWFSWQVWRFTLHIMLKTPFSCILDEEIRGFHWIQKFLPYPPFLPRGKIKRKNFVRLWLLHGLYRTSHNSVAKLTSSQLDEWRQLSRWQTSTSLCQRKYCI